MIQEFLQYEKTVKNLADNTVRAYEEDMRAFARHLKANTTIKRWSDVHKHDIDNYLSCQHNAGRKPASIRRSLASIRAFYNYAMNQGLTSTNPARYCEQPKKAQDLPNVIDTQAIESYIADERKPMALRALVAVLYETGIRISEATSLQARDINWREHTMRVYGKGLKARIVVFGNWSEKLLTAYLDNGKRTGDIWQGAAANQRAIRYEIHRAFRESATNGKASPHTIRHTYATRMLEQGMPIQTLQALLGHTHIETTQQYQRTSTQTLVRDYQRATA